MDIQDKDAIAFAFESALIESGGTLTVLRAWCDRHPTMAADFLASASSFTLGLLDDDALSVLPPNQEVANIGRRVLAARSSAQLARNGLLASILAEARKIDLSAQELAERWRLDDLLVLKIERRLLTLSAFPSELIDMIADSVQRTALDVIEYLSRGPKIPAAQFKSSGTPTASKQTFHEALEQSSDITDDDRTFWLAELSSGRVVEGGTAYELGE